MDEYSQEWSIWIITSLAKAWDESVEVGDESNKTMSESNDQNKPKWFINERR